ncbi:T9SS type A sorting domain-containing protein [Aurantibacillus circumpalustris]|uniref:T9SS type A sorting domain-containing protein n=1 Tax=Aurantibacillus circumpalustris TaxID=3036359 RepID=UPI00295BD82E|nr:T9SS type A sorting domain-containing protein [Aurantibacillus circumpalustris]
MIHSKLVSKILGSLLIFLSVSAFCQTVPLANFSISPNPICSGSANVVQISDHSSGSPTSWSYVINSAGPGPGGSTTLTVQNPTLIFNGQGTYTVTLITTNASGASIPYTQTLSVLPSPNAQINPGNQTSCLGGNPLSIAVLAGGPGSNGNTYLWSTSATSSSISVSPSVTTTYSCVITATNGCSVERTAIVNISQPTIVINSNPANICPGTSSTLTATGTNPGPFTYSWSTSATTRTISTNLAAVYDVTVTNGNGCTATQSYTLGTSTTLSLTATSNPSVLCAGNTATLRVTGASSYSWNTGATSPNMTVNPTSQASYTVMGQTGTCTGTTSITLNVSLTPTLVITTSNASVCSGNSTTLSANGATSYTWLPSTFSSSTTVTPLQNTTYTVRGNNVGCPNRTATISISVLPNPNVSISSSSSLSCAGEVVAIAASGASNYTWSTGINTAILIVTPTVTSTYSVTASDLNNCYNSATIVQNVSDCVGITQLDKDVHSLKIYPNPSEGRLTITSTSNMEINIYDLNGRLVKTIVLSEGNNKTYFITDLSKGLYYVYGKNEDELVKQKILILN